MQGASIPLHRPGRLASRVAQNTESSEVSTQEEYHWGMAQVHGEHRAFEHVTIEHVHSLTESPFMLRRAKPELLKEVEDCEV